LDKDDELIKLSLAGDIEAFEALVEKYQQKIYNLSYRYMGTEQDAYDMAQETLIKAFRSLGTFKGDSSLGTWLYRITTNVCLDELRKRKRTLHIVSLDEPLATTDGDEIDRDIPDPSPTADILYEQRQMEAYLQSVIATLKPEHKSVIILRDVMGLTYEEVAEALECSIGTVKSRLNRGREVLRKKISKQELLP